MDPLDLLIQQIRMETQVGGNTRERVANALQLLRDKSFTFKKAATVSDGPLSMRTDGNAIFFTNSIGQEQQIMLTKDFIDAINIGITGNADFNTQPSTTKFERWTVYKAGTYVHFLDGNGQPTVVTEQELEDNDVIFTVTNGVTTKNLSPKANYAIVPWIAASYKAKRQVYYQGGIWEAPNGAVPGDIPGEGSTVWVLRLQGMITTVGKKAIVQILDATGGRVAQWDENGNFITNYDHDIIPTNAVKGLAYWMRDVTSNLSVLNDAIQFRYTNIRIAANAQIDENLKSDITDFVDSQLKKYIHVDDLGVVRIEKLKVGSLRNAEYEHAEKYPVFEGTSLAIPEQGFMYIDFIYGTLPPDKVTTTKQVMVLRDQSKQIIATLNTEMVVQGNYTAGLPKKGYSIDLFNKFGKDVTLKIGSRPPLKGFHLKAYMTDFTQTRDVAAGKLWQSFIRSNPYPYNQFKRILPTRKPNVLDFEQFSSDAPYALLGPPCEVRMDGRFEGLFTWRTKKTDPVYAVNSKRDTCIFIESQSELAGGFYVGLGGYAYANFAEVQIAYEIRSPKSKNITQTTKDKTMRFFQWCRQVFTGALTNQQVRDTQSQYINLPHWIDWIIIAEFLIHWDSIHNNAGYISYDSDHWSPILIDLDHTLDNNGSYSHVIDGGMIISEDIFGKFKTIFLPEIKARYTELRKTGVLTNESIRKIYGGISENIPWDSYVNDFKRWNIPAWWWQSLMVPSMDMVYDVAKRRITTLDNVWLNP